MPELVVRPDRYDGAPLAAQLDADLLEIGDGEASITMTLGDDDEFALYFELQDGAVAPALLATAKRLLAALGGLENHVQAASAEACRRTGEDPMHFEGELAYVRVFHDRALLRYFGTRVNIEWDELVQWRDGRWDCLGVMRV